MTLLRMLLLGLLLAAFTGCGKNENVDVTPIEVSAPMEEAKTLLQEIAKTGEVGSGAEIIRGAFGSIKSTDSAKADSLLADLDALEALSDPSAAKAKAQEMLGKL